MKQSKSSSKGNPHDFKRAKNRVLKNYARRRGLRKGTRSYNAYVYGSVSHRMASKRRARRRGR